MNKQGYHRRSFVHLYMTASAVCKLYENWTKSENILTWSGKKKLLLDYREHIREKEHPRTHKQYYVWHILLFNV